MASKFVLSSLLSTHNSSMVVALPKYLMGLDYLVI